EELKAFRDHLQILGAPIARRYSGGKDIGAACGTLEASQYGGVVLPPPVTAG
ncbi:MAG TPA: rRNA methyltransferase, partial [Archangium sp.]|nr:rRNA methyltransferase [Archangium sp.]